MKTVHLEGISAFPLTPMDAAGKVDQGILRELLQRLKAVPVDSVGLLGSTGMYPFLEREQRRLTIKTAATQLAGRTPLLAGIGALRTDMAINLAKDACDAGADIGLLAPVSYTPLLADEVFEHFKAVAAASPLSLCIYNNPSTTHFVFSDDLIVRLSELPNVVAVKHVGIDNVGPQVEALRRRTKPGFSIGYSVDGFCAEAMIVGADAWYTALGGLFPEPCLEITSAIARGEVDAARAVNRRLKPVWDVFKEFGSARCIYTAAAELGFNIAPPLPLQPLQNVARQRVVDAMSTALLLPAS